MSNRTTKVSNEYRRKHATQAYVSTAFAYDRSSADEQIPWPRYGTHIFFFNPPAGGEE